MLPPILTTSAEVAAFAARLQQFPVIAVDLEADSMHNYQDKVCLLQFTTPDETVLIDPLSGADMEPIKIVLGDPAIRKLFHAADYDIRSLARDFDIHIEGLFDTMLSCQFLGEEKFGLADVLRKYYQIELDKKFQRADWSMRPLPEGMIVYAAEDTRHLHQLAEMLEERLRAKGRLEWVQEEFALLEKVRFASHEGLDCLRFKGASILNPRQLAVLECLLQWRDSEAQRRDSPVYKVLGGKPLLEVARIMPQVRNQLQGIEGLPPRLLDRYAAKLLAAVAAGLEWPEDRLPVYPRTKRLERDPQLEERVKKLKEWRRKAAATLGIDPGVLINNATLEELGKRQPQSAADLEEIELLKNWQRKELGAGILAALR
jgi:ribonuclease D